MGLVSDVVDFLVGFILRPLFALVSYSYNMIMAIANLDLFGGTLSDGSEYGWFGTLSTRIYILLGVFMLFRVGFSMLQYIVNPDKMTDKSTGVGNLVKKAVIALLILVLFQPALKLAMNFQKVVLEENVLGTIILGVAPTGDDENYQRNFGDMIPSTILKSLTTVDDAYKISGEATSCWYTSGTVEKPYTIAELEMMRKSSDSGIKEDAEKCINEFNTLLDQELMGKVVDFLRGGSAPTTFDALIQPTNFYAFFDINIIPYIDYNIIILLVLAIAFILCFLSLALQLGVRVIKLAFLALIAPIPIIGYISPGSDKMLGNWAKELGKTYLMIFIRLAALYFVILVIIMVSDVTMGGLKNYNGEDLFHDNFVSDALMSGQLQCVIFLAAFIFADQVPKMIENIFGLKLEGGMFKNPIKQLKESKSFMGSVGGAIGAGFGAARALPQLKKLKGQVGNVKNGLNNKFGTGISKDKFKAGMKAYGNLAHKAGANIGNIGRSAKRTAKDLQENKQGFMEGIVDSQTKAAEEGYNKASRAGAHMMDKILGKQFPLKEAKETEEKVSKASGKIVDTALDNASKKDNDLKMRQKGYEQAQGELENIVKTGKTKEMEALETKIKQAQSEHVQQSESQRSLIEQKQGIQQENSNLLSQQHKIGNDLSSVTSRLSTIKSLEAQKQQLTNEMLSGTLNLGQQEYQAKLQDIDAQLSGVDVQALETQKAQLEAEIGQITAKINANSAQSANIDTEIAAATATMAATAATISSDQETLDDMSKDVESVIRDKQQKVLDLQKDYEDYKKVRTGKVANRWLALYEILNENYDGDIDAMKAALDSNQALRERLAQDRELFQYFTDNDYEALTTTKDENGNPVVDYKNLFEIDNEVKNMLEHLKNLARARADDKEFLDKLKAVSVLDANGNKDEKRYQEVRTLFKDAQDAADAEIVRLSREIEEIETGTRGMGTVDETFNPGDISGMH